MSDMQTLRGYRQKCRVKVKVNGEEKEATLLFEPGYNDDEVGDRVYLEPLGRFNTDDVELIDVLPWK